MFLLSLSSVCLTCCRYIAFSLQLFSLSSLSCCLNSFGWVEFSLGTLLLILTTTMKGLMWCLTYHSRLFCSASTHTCILAIFFLYTYNLSISFLGCSSLFNVMTFLVFLSVSSSSLFVYFTVPAPYFIKETAHVFIAMILVYFSWLILFSSVILSKSSPSSCCFPWFCFFLKYLDIYIHFSQLPYFFHYHTSPVL